MVFVVFYKYLYMKCERISSELMLEKILKLSIMITRANRNFMFFLINVFVLVIIILTRSFLISVQKRFFRAPCTNTYKFISIGSYFPEVCAFGTLIMSTKVFRLIICKTL